MEKSATAGLASGFNPLHGTAKAVLEGYKVNPLSLWHLKLLHSLPLLHPLSMMK
jgi:hypothetical protein